MPGVKFYYDKDATLKKYFGSYTQGHDWNAPGAITDEDKGGPNDFVLSLHVGRGPDLGRPGVEGREIAGNTKPGKKRRRFEQARR